MATNNPNLGKANPSIEIQLAPGEAIDLANRLPDGKPASKEGEQTLVATVIGFGNQDLDGEFGPGIEASSRTLQVFDRQTRNGYQMDLGNKALTDGSVLSVLRQGHYKPESGISLNPEALQKQRANGENQPRFHLVLNHEGTTSLITADQDKAMAATKHPDDTADIVLNQSANAILNEGIGLDHIAAVIDKDSWELLADSLEAEIKASEDAYATGDRGMPPPRLDNLPPLFPNTPLDLPPEMLASRLEVIDEYRSSNAPDLRCAMELIELAIVERFSKPANEHRIRRHNWETELLNDRGKDDSLESLGEQYRETQERMQSVEGALRYQIKDTGYPNREALLTRALLNCELQELDYAIEDHPEAKAGQTLS